MEGETDIIDETLYDDFAVSEVDEDTKEEGVSVTTIVDVGVSFEVKLLCMLIEGVKVEVIEDDPLTDDELDG